MTSNTQHRILISLGCVLALISAAMFARKYDIASFVKLIGFGLLFSFFLWPGKPKE